jgi:four helix bundle protein
MEVMEVMEVRDMPEEVAASWFSQVGHVAEARASYGSAPRSHRDLKIYARAFTLAMRIHEVAASLPAQERYALADQMTRSSRSVCSNLAEAWRKRRYKAALIAKLTDAEAEAAETQTWIEFLEGLGYLEPGPAQSLWGEYEALIGSIVGVISNADKWIVRPRRSASSPSPPSPPSP